MSAPGEFRSPIKILLPQIREGMGLDFRGMFLLRDSVQYVPDGFFFYFVCSFGGIHVVKLNKTRRKKFFS